MAGKERFGAGEHVEAATIDESHHDQTSTPRATIATPEVVRQLGLTTDVATAGTILGIGRSKAYEPANSGELPVAILHAGRRYLVLTTPCLRSSALRGLETRRCRAVQLRAATVWGLASHAAGRRRAEHRRA